MPNELIAPSGQPLSTKKKVMSDADTENYLEVYGDSDWKDGWPENIVVFNTKTRANEVYVRYHPTAAAESST